MSPRRTLVSLLCLALLVLCMKTSVEASNQILPKLPGASLLLASFPTGLAVTTEDHTSTIEGGGEWYVSPTMSADGSVIASARSVVGDPPSGRPRLIVGTYSLVEGKWTDYKGLEVYDGTIAVSPDGSKLACISRAKVGGTSVIRVLDRKTGALTPGLESSRGAGPDISWSPDGRHIVFDREDKRLRNGLEIPELRAVYVLDVESGHVSKIADGAWPSWSPSGEWIAFFDFSPNRDDIKRGWFAVNANRVSLMHPDGSGFRVLTTFSRDADLQGLIWSPDSRTVLIQTPQDESVLPRMDIYSLDIASHKLTKRFKKAPPIYAWEATK